MAASYALSVVVPCLNEEGNLPILVERVLAATADAGIPTEVVVVDDGSTDGTWDVLEAARRRFGDAVAGVRHPANRGIAAAWRSGLDASRGAFVCFIDGDLQNPPEEVPRLYRRLVESPHDLVQGTRSSIGRLRDSRFAFSKGLNFLLNRLFAMSARDNKSGFVMASRQVLDDVLSYRGRYHYFQTFISVSAKAKGYSILEVETIFENRHAGRSFMDTGTWGVVGRAFADLPRAFVEFRLRARPRHGAGVVPISHATPARRHPYRGRRRLRFELYFATMPLHKWLITRRARGMYLDLKTTEWLPATEMRELQLAKLQRLVQHASVHVPYYRRVLSLAGIKPDDVRSLDDLARLPLLSKDDVRSHLHFEMFSDDHRKQDLHRISTSGSTGEPFTTYADRYQLEMRFATTLRALEWTGWRFGDRQVRLWHQTLGMTKLQTIRERIDAWFVRRKFIPAFELRPDTLGRFVEALEQHRPVLVDGYAESLNFLATYIREGGTATFHPQAVMSSAQALPENVRRVIEDGFQTKVYDKYGSREFSGIAYECGHAPGHHVMDESYLVEILVDGRPARPGEIGEIVITDLNNFSVPLIRYRIGDLATAVASDDPCPCGRGLSRIGTIQGRTQAIVHCGNGVWLPGTFFAHFFKDYEHAIRFFQIHQDRKGAFTLRVVRNRQFSDAEFERILGSLRGYVGDESVTDIDVEFVDEIPLVRTGKRSPVVSTIREDFQSLSPAEAPARR